MTKGQTPKDLRLGSDMRSELTRCSDNLIYVCCDPKMVQIEGNEVDSRELTSPSIPKFGDSENLISAVFGKTTSPLGEFRRTRE
jgi:hypothetical protein